MGGERQIRMICGCQQASCADANSCSSAAPAMDSQTLSELLGVDSTDDDDMLIKPVLFWPCYRRLRGVDTITVREAELISAQAGNVRRTLFHAAADLAEMKTALQDGFSSTLNATDNAFSAQLDLVDTLHRKTERQMASLRSVERHAEEIVLQQRNRRSLVACAAAAMAVRVARDEMPPDGVGRLEILERVWASLSYLRYHCMHLPTGVGDVIAVLIGHDQCVASKQLNNGSAQHLLAFALETGGRAIRSDVCVPFTPCATVSSMDSSWDKLLDLPDLVSEIVAEQLSVAQLRKCTEACRGHPFMHACRRAMVIANARTAENARKTTARRLQALVQLGANLDQVANMAEDAELDALLDECGDLFRMPARATRPRARSR